MKRLLCLIALLVTIGASAQNPTTYFMDGYAMRSQWNPAFAPKQGYFNIPLIGALQVGVQGNLALDNILYRESPLHLSYRKPKGKLSALKLFPASVLKGQQRGGRIKIMLVQITL